MGSCWEHRKKSENGSFQANFGHFWLILALFLTFQSYNFDVFAYSGALLGVEWMTVQNFMEIVKTVSDNFEIFMKRSGEKKRHVCISSETFFPTPKNCQARWFTPLSVYLLLHKVNHSIRGEGQFRSNRYPEDDKVVDHCHWTRGMSFGSAHPECNLKWKTVIFIPVIAHISSKNDLHNDCLYIHKFKLRGKAEKLRWLRRRMKNTSPYPSKYLSEHTKTKMV